MVFCNVVNMELWYFEQIVTILILIDGFLQCLSDKLVDKAKNVTILILIDGFLQCGYIISQWSPLKQSQSLF